MKLRLVILLSILVIMFTGLATAIEPEIYAHITASFPANIVIQETNIYPGHLFPEIPEVYIIFYEQPLAGDTTGITLAKIAIYSDETNKILWESNGNVAGTFILDANNSPVRDITHEGLLEIVSNILSHEKPVLKIYQWNNLKKAIVSIPFLGGSVEDRIDQSPVGNISYQDLNNDGTVEIIISRKTDSHYELDDIFEWNGEQQIYQVANFKFGKYYKEDLLKLENSMDDDAVKTNPVARETSLFNLAKGYMYLKRFDDAKLLCSDHLEQLKQDAKKTSVYAPLIAKTYALLGDIENDLGKPASAKSYYSLAAEYACYQDKQTLSADTIAKTTARTKTPRGNGADTSTPASSWETYEKNKENKIKTYHAHYYLERGLDIPELK